MSLNTQILIAAIFGVIFGFILNLFPETVFLDMSLYGIGVVSSIFIGLLKMLLIPLIFSSIVVGVSNLQAGGQLSRVWKITVACCVTTTTLALILGLSCARFSAPARRVDIYILQKYTKTHKTQIKH